MVIKEEFLLDLCKGLANHFGEKCEVVYHDLTKDYDQTIVFIENGHITGRNVGGPGTNEGLKMFKAVKDGLQPLNYATYLSRTKDGKVLKSTSIYIRDKENNVVGSICLNFDVTEVTILQNFLKSLTETSDDNITKEYYSNDINSLLDDMIEESIAVVGRPISQMSKEDKVKSLHYLDDRGAFLIKKAGDRICRIFNISKNTLYNYLDEPRDKVI